MVRQVPVPSTFRNRNRITHKSRLKIHHGNLDAEPYIPDEDEEKSRQQHSVAGVDQDDANVCRPRQPITVCHTCGCVVRGLLITCLFRNTIFKLFSPRLLNRQLLAQRTRTKHRLHTSLLQTQLAGSAISNTWPCIQQTSGRIPTPTSHPRKRSKSLASMVLQTDSLILWTRGIRLG